MTNTLAVAWYRFRGTIAGSWGGFVAIFLLVGILGGISMASLEAARLTQSSYPTFLASTNPSDLSVSVYAPSTGDAVSTIAPQIASIPDVKAVRTVEETHTIPLKPDGAPLLSALDDVNFLASIDGEFLAQDKLSVLQGRLADPARPDEIVVDANAARILHLHVGETFGVGTYAIAQTRLPGFGTPSVTPRVRDVAKVVGIIVLNNQVLQDDIDRQYGLVLYTPALLRRDEAVNRADRSPIAYALQLKNGASGVTAAEAAIGTILPSSANAEYHVVSRVEDQVELSLRPVSLAIGAFGAIAGLACLVLALQAIGRVLRSRDEDRRVLRSLGAGRATVASEGLPGVFAAILCAAVLAVLIALALSPLWPLGPVRPVYPYRGVAGDWLVFAVGVVVIVGVLGVAAVAWSLARAPQREATRRRRVRRSSLAAAAEASGLPVTCSIGVRFALESRDGRSAVPLRSSVLGTLVAVMLVVTTLTFASSFRTLVTHPALYGWNWSYVLAPTNALPPTARLALDRDPDVAAWTGVDYNDVTIDGLTVPVIMERGRANRVVPPILAGHAVDNPRQIVIGAATLAALHKRIGQYVSVGYSLRQDFPLYVKPHELKIVGIATFPAIGYESLVADHTSMGTGALFNESFFPAAFERAVTSPDPNLRGPELAFVRLRSDVSSAAGRRDMQRIADIANRVFASDPHASGNSVLALGVQRPAQIVSYRSIESTPVALAAALAVGALVALALTLISSVQRRRRDLALLKALGFTPRQLATSVAWQATVATVIGVAFGVPVGVVLGRQLWILFARGLNAVPYPTVPALLVGAVAVGAVVFANLLAIAPGRSAGRTSTSTLLRSD